jgi:hypothetical protein
MGVEESHTSDDEVSFSSEQYEDFIVHLSTHDQSVVKLASYRFDRLILRYCRHAILLCRRNTSRANLHDANILIYIRKQYASFLGDEGLVIPIRVATGEEQRRGCEYRCKLCCDEPLPSLTQLVTSKIVMDFLSQTATDFHSIVLASTVEQQQTALEWSAQSLEHFKKLLEKIPTERLIPDFLLCELENCITQAMRQNDKYLGNPNTIHNDDPPEFFDSFEDGFVRLAITYHVFSNQLVYVNSWYPLEVAIFAVECGDEYASLWKPSTAQDTRQYPI